MNRWPSVCCPQRRRCLAPDCALHAAHRAAIVKRSESGLRVLPPSPLPTFAAGRRSPSIVAATNFIRCGNTSIAGDRPRRSPIYSHSIVDLDKNIIKTQSVTHVNRDRTPNESILNSCRPTTLLALQLILLMKRQSFLRDASATAGMSEQPNLSPGHQTVYRRPVPHPETGLWESFRGGC